MSPVIPASPQPYIDFNMSKVERRESYCDQSNRYAIKITRTNDEEMIKIAQKEFRLVSNLNHPNIIKMKKLF